MHIIIMLHTQSQPVGCGFVLIRLVKTYQSQWINVNMRMCKQG